MNIRALFFKIYKNGQLIEVKQFHTERIDLGSGDVDIRLEGLLPSHAVIQKESDGLYHIVISAGVEPGIFVSGQQIWRYPLVSYGVFQLGYYHIEFWEMLSQSASIPSPAVVAHTVPTLNPAGDVEKTEITTTQVTSSPPFVQTQQTPPPQGPQVPVHPSGRSIQNIPTAAPPQNPQVPSYPKTSVQSGFVPPSQSPQAPPNLGMPTQSGSVPQPPQSPQAPPNLGMPTQSGSVPQPPQSSQAPPNLGMPTQSGSVPLPPQSSQAPPNLGMPTQSGSVPQPPQSPQAPPNLGMPTQSGSVPQPPQSSQAPPNLGMPTQSGSVPQPPQSSQAPPNLGMPTQSGTAFPPPPQSPQTPPDLETLAQIGPAQSEQILSDLEASVQNDLVSSQVAGDEPYLDINTQVQQNLLHSIQAEVSRSSSFNLPTEVPESVFTKPTQQEVKQTHGPEENIVQSSPSQMEMLQKDAEPSDQQKSGGYRKKRTFANNSHLKDINERIQPENGSVVKVIVTWNDKILNTLYFDYNSTVKVGSHSKNDIVLPVFSHSTDSHSLIKIKNLASLFVTYEMRGVLVKGSESIAFDDIINSGAASRQDTGFTIDLQRGELARVDFDSGISIFVKYTVPSAKPLIGPFFDFTSGELNTIIMAIGGSIIMAIFFLIAHEPEVVKLEEEVERKAIFVYKPPPPPPRIDPIPVKPKPIKVKPKKVRPMAKKQKPSVERVKRNRVKKKRTKVVQQKTQKAKVGKTGGGRSANKSKNRQAVAAANTSKTKNRSRRSGVAVGRKAKKDVSKSGLLGAFAKGGQQDSLREAFDGTGVVENLAQQARGRGGGRSGSIGGGLAAVGKGGRGESTYGIRGIKTKGRGGGGGIKGAGSGSLGGKLNVRVDVSGGVGESFEGVIDKDAIRRVVKRNVKQLRTCYERLAQRNANASGRVDLNWTIEANGVVGSVKVVKSQIRDKKTLDCMKLRLSSWKFPDPPEGVIGDINYPFVFVISRQ